MRSIVEESGHLKVTDNRIVDAKDSNIILRGVSLFWSQWMPQFYNAEVVEWLRDDWKCNVIRVAMAVNFGGYRQNAEEEWKKVVTVVDAAIRYEIYVIVDWHSHEMEIESALAFFQRLSEKYGDCPNIIYETWNEPYPCYGWKDHIKPYHLKVASTIRKNAPRSLILAGTENYSQRPDIAAEHPLPLENIAYTIHFYAATHGERLIDNCRKSLNEGIALMASEYGTCESNGSGALALEATTIWLQFLTANSVGHVNWSIADKLETSAALLPGANPHGQWKITSLTPSGQFVRNYLRSGFMSRLNKI